MQSVTYRAPWGPIIPGGTQPDGGVTRSGGTAGTVPTESKMRIMKRNAEAAIAAEAAIVRTRLMSLDAG